MTQNVSTYRMEETSRNQLLVEGLLVLNQPAALTTTLFLPCAPRTPTTADSRRAEETGREAAREASGES